MGKEQLPADRLSNLPDNLLHHILSFLETKSVIQTSSLSKRWRNLWTSVPNLDVDGRSFHQIGSFRNFVYQILNERNNNFNVGKLRFCYYGKHVDVTFINEVMSYAMSKRVNHLIIQFYVRCFPYHLPQAVLSCQSLKTLELMNLCNLLSNSFATTLTTLRLVSCLFLGNGSFLDPFANCCNLKKLSVLECGFREVKILKISGPEIVNLTLEILQEENFMGIKVEIFTPKLTSFRCICSEFLCFSSIHLPILEHANIDFRFFHPVDPNVSVGWSWKERKDDAYSNLLEFFERLHNAQFITLSQSVVKALIEFGDLLEHQTSPFRKVKSLKLISNTLGIPVEVLNYFLSGSPCLEELLVDLRKGSRKSGQVHFEALDDYPNFQPTL